jgi:hypothetical protein
VCCLQLEYGYQLQQNLLGAPSFKALMESFPDACAYKAHQRNTLVMHPSPVMHLRLLLRLLLAPAELAQQQQQGAAGADTAVNPKPNSSDGGAAGSSNKILSAVTQLAALQGDAFGPVLGAVTGFSAATASYPGCPASNTKPALDLLATAVEAALSSVASLGKAGPGGATVYPVVAVNQAFEAVYGYQLPLRRLGCDHFKQLLLELEAECSLTPEHKLTGAGEELLVCQILVPPLLAACCCGALHSLQERVDFAPCWLHGCDVRT